MRITSLKIENIKCFEEIVYDFNEADKYSVLIAGDNGQGKTTILRCLAISLCDIWSAAGLLRELSGEFVREGHPSGSIEVTLENEDALYKVSTMIETISNYERPVRQHYIWEDDNWQLVTEDVFPWDEIFTTAYGAGLRTLGSEDYQYYFSGDSLYSLFKYESQLQNPELAYRRILDSLNNKKAEKNWQSEIEALLKNVLNLDLEDGKVTLEHNGIYLHRASGSSHLSSSADGFKAATTVVLDILAWWLLYSFEQEIPFETESASGIVIIDEIEKHLHPIWQQTIFENLKAAFPNMQFIVSTHSPLVLTCTESDALILQSNPEKRRVDARLENLSGWLPDDALRAMGIENVRYNKTSHKLENYEKLYKKQLAGELNQNEEIEFQEMLSYIEKLPPGDPIKLTIELKAMTEEASKK